MKNEKEIRENLKESKIALKNAIKLKDWSASQWIEGYISALNWMLKDDKGEK